MGMIVGICLLIHALANIGTLCCCPSEKEQAGQFHHTPSTSGSTAAVDNSALLPTPYNAASAATDWAQNNPESAKRAAAAGLNFARENPEMARSAMSAGAHA